MSKKGNIYGCNIWIENSEEAAMEAFANIINGSYSEEEDVVFVEFEEPIVTDEDHLKEVAQYIVMNMFVPASKHCNCKMGEISFILS